MIKVGVIRGGISSEYAVSLATGENVLSCLRNTELNQKYKAIDVLITKDGIWHINGLPINSLEELHNKVDVVLNALHGEFGEDGKIQQMLDQWNIPYTGSRAFASALGYNKNLSKEHFNNLGIKTPRHFYVPAYDSSLDGDKSKYALKVAKFIWEKMPAPWIVKPVVGGSSMGIHVCKTFDSLVFAFEMGIVEAVDVLVEEMIEGREATVGVLEGFRGQDLYAFPSVEIRLPKQKTHFDYEAKYNGMSQEICPGNFSFEQKKELEELAKKIHKGLGLEHYSRTDFIIHPKKGIYAIEVNTLPGLTKESLLPKAILAVGSSMVEFLDHLLTISLNKKQ